MEDDVQVSRGAPAEGVVDSRPTVLVLGGTGLVGRHLLSQLVDTAAASRIRVLGKMPPQIAYMAPSHAKAYDDPAVEFIQGDPSRATSLERAFKGAPFDYVINLSLDSVPLGQTAEVYDQLVVQAAVGAAAAAAAHSARRYVDLSTALVYEPSSKPSAESSKTKTWTKLAAAKLKAEAELRAAVAGSGLSVVSLRAAVIYGPGDMRSGIAGRLLCAAAYKHLGEKMRFLWDGELAVATVHAADVASAAWHVATLASPAPVYNLADPGCTTQRSIGEAITALCGVRVSFAGSLASNAVKLKLGGLHGFAEIANDKHMEPFSELCRAGGVTSTPLTPFQDAELLAHNHISVDGRAICATGFSYSRPRLTTETLREQVQYWRDLAIVPSDFLGSS